jgi:ABC-type phosphate/phosphonate transport system substrate-binding protein
MSLAGLVPVLGRAATTATAVKVGLTGTIFPDMSELLLRAATRPFRSLLESATGLTGQVVQSGDARSLADKLKQDKVQLGVFQGIEFAWARVSNPKLEPIVICVNYQRTLKAFLVVRAASEYRSPADLRDKVLTMPPETREHCKVFLQRKCLPAGLNADKFYKKVALAGDVEEALDDVLDRQADAALVDGLPWGSYRKSKPGCGKQLRVLLSSEAFPCGVIACQQGRFQPERVQHFRTGLAAAGKTPRGRQLLDFLRITGFETPPDGYDRLFGSIVKAYPPPGK